MSSERFASRRAFLRAALSIAGLAGIVVAPAPAAAAPVELVDAVGRKVTLARPPERIVNTFYYEEFTAVGGVDAWAKVVAMSRVPWEGWRPAIFKRYAAIVPNLATMPDVGDVEGATFSAEKVLAAAPDVVLFSAWAWDAAQAQRDRILSAGIPIVVLDYNAQELEKHLASTRALGKVLGAGARAEELARFYESRWRQVMERVPRERAPRPKVHVELGRDGPETIGNSYRGTMWGRILDQLGADNIANGHLAGAWGPIPAEAVLAADPDLILIAGSSWANRPKAVPTGFDARPEEIRARLEAYKARPGWQDLKAVRTGRLAAIEHGLCRALHDIAAIEFLAKAIYPDLFADLEPERTLAEYYARFLPVPFSGTWMLAPGS